MSDMIDKVHGRKLGHLVRIKNKGFFYVDTVQLASYYETMVFPYDIIEEQVTSYSELYCERYFDYMSAEEGHLRICFNLENYLSEGE